MRKKSFFGKIPVSDDNNTLSYFDEGYPCFADRYKERIKYTFPFKLEDTLAVIFVIAYLFHSYIKKLRK